MEWETPRCKRSGRGCQCLQSIQGGAGGRVQLRGPARQGSDIWAQCEQQAAPAESGESQWRPAVQTEGGSRRPRGEGRECCSCCCFLSSDKTNLLLQHAIASGRQGRSGWAGEKWGRFAVTTANWWADLESRHKLNAVRQAQIAAVEVLCCSAVPGTARVSLCSPAEHCAPPQQASPPFRLPAGPVAQLPKPLQLRVLQCLMSSCQSSG